MRAEVWLRRLLTGLIALVPVAARAEPSQTLQRFVGLVELGGPAYGGVTATGYGWDKAVQGSGLLALRAGVLVDRSEIAIEVSPFTYLYYTPIPGPAFQLNVTYGQLIPLVRHHRWITWPLRFGLGFFAGNVGGDVYVQARADLLGVSVRAGDFMINLYAPSFRYALLIGYWAHLLSWEYGVSADYVF